MAHKFVLERPTEIEAFREYANVFPKNTTLLIDTYNTIAGAKNACIVAHEMEARGAQLNAVRLDSGDLLSLSKEVRNIIDAERLEYVQIIASHELDEYRIDTLLSEGAPIDAFGVGTRLATGNTSPMCFLNSDERGVPALGGVFKLVEREGVPVGKLSLDEPEKATHPGRKQVYRQVDADGYYEKDIVTLWDEPIPEGEPLLVPIISNGKLVYNFPNMVDIQARTKAELAMLPECHKGLYDAEAYPVEIRSFA